MWMSKGRTLVRQVKYGTDWIVYGHATTACFFMVRHQKSPRHHGNSVGKKLTLFTMKHYQGLKTFLTTFEVDVVNELEGVHRNMYVGGAASIKEHCHIDELAMYCTCDVCAKSCSSDSTYCP